MALKKIIAMLIGGFSSVVILFLIITIISGILMMFGVELNIKNEILTVISDSEELSANVSIAFVSICGIIGCVLGFIIDRRRICS